MNKGWTREWAVCRSTEKNGWVHKFELETDGLRILEFQDFDALVWLAELMKHRDAADSKRYRVLAEKFISRYGIDTSGYDDDGVWGGVRQVVVYEGLLAKFGQNRELADRLRATGNDLLAECAVGDRIWGIGLSMDDERRFDMGAWRGQNPLGYTLMMARTKLASG